MNPFYYFSFLLSLLLKNSALHCVSGSQLTPECQQLLAKLNTTQLSHLGALSANSMLSFPARPAYHTASISQFYTLAPSTQPLPPTFPEPFQAKLHSKIQ